MESIYKYHNIAVWIVCIHRVVGTVEIWGEPGVLFCHRVKAGEGGDGGVVLAGSKVILVESIGGDQFLAAELVRLTSSRVSEVSDDASIGIVCDGLLDGTCRAVDDGTVVAFEV